MILSEATVTSLQLGGVRGIPAGGSEEWWDKPWQTGFLKSSAAGECWLGYEGFRGDEQADRRYHGGSEKAVCVCPAEHFPYWRGKLAEPRMEHGAFGENLTVSGLVESDVCIGDVFTLGGALVQVSQPRQPCWKLARRWRVKDLAVQVESTGFTGYYFRVLRHGTVRAGNVLRLETRTFPEWTVRRCNEIMHQQKSDQAAAAALSECPPLSASWKDALWARARRPAPDEGARDARLGME